MTLPEHMETYSGALLNLVEPQIEDISFHDIARSLSNLSRFAGHGWKFYSVAQHSCVVAGLLPEHLRHHGLLHDAHEAFVGDISSPVKAALGKVIPGFSGAFRQIESRLIGLIYEKADFKLPTPAESAQVKKADLVALAIEQREIMLSPNIWNLPHPATNQRIKPVAAEMAYLMFADALEDIGIETYATQKAPSFSEAA